MTAQPEEAAQTAGLKDAKLGSENMTATEMKGNQENEELPCLRNYAPWKEHFYEKVQQRCLRLQETKMNTIRAQKAKDEKIKKTEPCEWLFKEWLSEEKESLDTRIYLLDKLLPTLIPGIEKLLMEVERKNVLALDKEPTKFNPINFLGEYLMRHNPQYGISTKPGPYLRGMEMVMKELKTEIPGTTSERLATMKAEAKNKRKDREQVEIMKSQVKEMRKEALANQFKEWTADVSGRIPVALVQSALRSFPDVFASAPIDVRKVCDKRLEIVDALEKRVNEDEFTEYVHSYTEHLTHDMFQEVLKHLRQCADDFRETIRHDMWRQLFTDLFFDCDYGKVGLLDRQKILSLLIDFYDRSPVTTRRGFCNPRQWPIIELQEIKLVDLWGGLDQEVCEEFNEKLALSQTGIFEEEILARESVDDNRESKYRMRPDVKEGLLEEMGMNDTETGGISKEEKQAAESSDKLRKEGEKATSAVKSTDLEASDLDGDTIYSGKSSFHEDIKTERQPESAGADRHEEAFPGSASPGYSLGRDGELKSEKQVEEEEFSQGREPDTETNREKDYCILDREPGSEGQVTQAEDNWITEATNAISGPTPEATAMTSEDRAVADMDVIDSKQDPPIAEVVKETSARKQSSSRQHGSQSGQQTSSETRLQNEDLLQEQGKGPAHSDRQDSPPGTGQDFEVPWSGELLTRDLSCKYSSYGVRIPEDWKCEDTIFSDLHPIMAEIQNRWASCTRSAFDESCLNLPQFVQLMETFVGENISLLMVKRLIAFIKEKYKQTEEEKKEQLEKVHRIFHVAQRKLLLEALFEKWDNNASGFLDLEEVDAVLNTFKEGMEKEALRKGFEMEMQKKNDESVSHGRAGGGTAGSTIRRAQPGQSPRCIPALPSQEAAGSFQRLCKSTPVSPELAGAGSGSSGLGRAGTKVEQAADFSNTRIETDGLSRVGKLSPKAFQTFLELIASELTGEEDEAIDNLVEFLTTRVERSHMEHLQSLTRREWLHSIQQAAESSGANMEPVYKAVFKALSQDAEAHGDNKKISAYIALLEENHLAPERGQILLHYVACTPDDAPYVLNQILYKDMKGVSFAALEEGKPIHVPRVQLHGNIHFWNYDRPEEEKKGSFLVLPLHDARWRVFGILGLDTLQDQCEKAVFLPHEIGFYQGVSHAFSKAYHHICTLENLLQLTVTALDWLYPRAPSIHTATVYMVELGKDETWNYALRKMITTGNTGQKEIHSSPVLLRKENLLRDYLFKCTDSSEVILTSVYGEYHIAVPLRDLSGQALGIFDINTRHHQKLPPHEHKDLQKMLKMVQAACSEILKKSLEETEPTYVLEAEHVANLRHAGILFHRFMLQDLRECVQKLDAESFAEIRSCVEPPALVHNLVKAVLLLLHPNWKGSGKIENWSQCKLKLDDNLIQEIYCFDPTAASVQVQAELLPDCITGVPRAAMWQHSSIPAQYLYHWVHTCLSLAGITRSLQSQETHL